jgi:GMP synthase-like glutamine amidotransferase
VEFSSSAAKEGLRLYGELQIKAMDSVKALAEGAGAPQAAFRTAEENVQTLTRTAERLQATAEQAGKGIQATLADAVTKTKEIYARA